MGQTDKRTETVKVGSLIDPKLERYEYEKLAWIKFNPRATPRQYEEAMQVIAKRCGI